MKYHIYQEVTKWPTSVHNHIYVFKDKPASRGTCTAIGYVKAGSNTVEKFSKPLSIDLRYRTFVAVD